MRDEMEKTKKKIGADIPEEKLNEWKRSTAGLTNTVEYDNISKDFSVVK